MFGQVINRVGKIVEFGHKQGKGFGKRATHPHPVFRAGKITKIIIIIFNISKAQINM